MSVLNWFIWALLIRSKPRKYISIHVEGRHHFYRSWSLLFGKEVSTKAETKAVSMGQPLTVKRPRPLAISRNEWKFLTVSRKKNVMRKKISYDL